MISITLGTIVYGYQGNAIHIGGITDGNTPIAEIHFQPENELGYAIFTGEIFPTFTEALAQHIEKFGLFTQPNAVEILTEDEFTSRLMGSNITFDPPLSDTFPEPRFS